MSYIGRDLRTGAFRQLDDISSSFNSSTTGFTMQVNSTNVSVGDVNQILLSLGGVIQKPGTDFTVSGSTLTFTTAPAANTSFFAILLGSDNGGTVTPTDGSVTGDKIASDLSIATNVTITTADNTDTLTLTSTDADASSGPNLRMYRNSGSPADDDFLGEVQFEGRNDNSQDVIYGQILTRIRDASDGTEDAQLTLKTMVAGTARNRLEFNESEVVFNDDSIDVDFRVETDGNANMFVVDGGNDAVIFNGSTSNFASSSQAIQVYNSGLAFTSGYGIQGGVNADRASINLTSGSDGHVKFNVNNSEVARFTSGGLAIGGTGSANTLDDYEEGTWTPSGSSLGVATTHKAIYRKIGDIVVVYCDIEYNSSPSDVAQATSLSGLPFSSNDSYTQCNTKVATRNQVIEAEVSGSGVNFRDKADGVIMTRSEFAGNRTQHVFIYTTA